LAVGELAVNLADRKLYTKNASNVVVPVTNAPDSGFSFRNRIINGDMRIDQRNAGAAVTYPGGGSAGVELYVIDRWVGNSTGSTRFSMQQSTTAPAGFNNSLLITTTTAGTPGASDFCYFVHHIEGFNTADLGFGSASAQAVTLSFWVRSSLTGTFGGSIANGDSNRRYPFSFAISAANTWEYKTITIPGDTTGTWLTGNGRGMAVSFNLGSGSSNKGTAGAWATAGMAPTGSVDLVATAGATLNITGVQLEAGSVATPFERRPYGTELALCQRYFTSFTKSDSGNAGIASGFQAATTNAAYNIIFPVQMRAKPTATASLLISSDQVSFDAAATVGSINASPSSTSLVTNYSASGALFRPSSLFIQPNGFLAFSAEL
jgi:hypothetical protein